MPRLDVDFLILLRKVNSVNKREVEELIPIAYKSLSMNKEICKEGRVNKAYRGQIASFGSAIAMGSLISAVAFFRQDGEAKVSRSEFLNVIWELMKEKYKVQESKEIKDLCTYVLYNRDKNLETKEQVINCAIAIKLALNLFELVDEEADNDAKQ